MEIWEYVKEPKYRKDLNDLQKDILVILYKFRFATRDLIVTYLGLKSSTYTHYRLKILLEQKYIGRHYSGQDKMNRQPASYYLLPEGMRILKALPDINQKALTNMYKDRYASQAFIERSLTTFRLYNKLRQLYGDDLTFYSKTDMSEYDFFPKKLPDGYFQLRDTAYMLDWLPATTTYTAIRSRLSYLIEHYKSDEWGESWTDYPTILLVCGNPYLERQAQRLAARLLRNEQDDESFDNNLAFRTTTIKAFINSLTNDPIWTDVLEPESPTALLNWVVGAQAQ